MRNSPIRRKKLFENRLGRGNHERTKEADWRESVLCLVPVHDLDSRKHLLRLPVGPTLLACWFQQANLYLALRLSFAVGADLACGCGRTHGRSENTKN